MPATSEILYDLAFSPKMLPTLEAQVPWPTHRAPLVAFACGVVGNSENYDIGHDTTVRVDHWTTESENYGHGKTAIYYSVASTEQIRKHPNWYIDGEGILDELKYIKNPWGNIGDFALNSIKSNSKMEGLPPVHVFFAHEGDLTLPGESTYGLTSAVGRYISVSGSALKLGVVEDEWDLPFIIVWGSDTLGSRYFTEIPTRVGFTIKHELTHLLTLLAGNKIVPGYDGSTNQMESVATLLGFPLWESIANIVPGRVDYAALEQSWLLDSSLLRHLPEGPKLPFHLRQGRNLGNVPVLVSELFFERLIRTWNGECLESMVHNNNMSRLAVSEFLSAIFEADSTHLEENGSLGRQTFNERLNLINVIKQIKELPENNWHDFMVPLMEPRIGPINPEAGKIIGQYLLDLIEEQKLNWEPFGKDTLRK